MSKCFQKVNSSCVTSVQPLQSSTTRPRLGSTFAVQAEAILHQQPAAGNVPLFEDWDHCSYHTGSVSKSPFTLLGVHHQWTSHLCQLRGWHKEGNPSSLGTAWQTPESSQPWSKTLQPQLPSAKLKAGHQQTALWPGPMRGAQSSGQAPAELPSGNGSVPPWGSLGHMGNTTFLRGTRGSSECGEHRRLPLCPDELGPS